MLVIDSSALVKLFSKEEGWEKVREYMTEGMTMSMSIAEVGNALLFKVLKHDLLFETANDILAKFARSMALMHDEEYVETALKTAHTNGITMYDSMFIAACIEEGFGLVTCDQKQAKVARKLGITVTEC